MALESVKRNGHNLDLGRFETVGAYGIPRLYPIHLDERIEWIRFNHALKEQSRSRLGVHFFIDDYLFLRVWNDPVRYAMFLRGFRAVMTPDFSLFADYAPAVQIYNHWRKHQLGASCHQLGGQGQLCVVLRRRAGGRHGGCFLRGCHEKPRRPQDVRGRLPRDADPPAARKDHLLWLRAR